MNLRTYFGPREEHDTEHERCDGGQIGETPAQFSGERAGDIAEFGKRAGHLGAIAPCPVFIIPVLNVRPRFLVNQEHVVVANDDEIYLALIGWPEYERFVRHYDPLIGKTGKDCCRLSLPLGDKSFACLKYFCHRRLFSANCRLADFSLVGSIA